MIATVYATLFLFGQGAAQTATFSNPQLNFTFAYPKTWSVTTTKKAVSTIVVPIPDSEEKATIEVYAVAFRREAELWQSLQKTLAENMKAEVARQWAEDLLGVPLLLTQIAMPDKTVLQGLLYSATENKFLFRLEAAPSVFPQAVNAWRSVWPSFRTVDGSLPEKEDPGAVPIVADPKQPPPARPAPITVLSQDKSTGEPELAPGSVACKAANRDLLLRIPEGWSGAPGQDGSIELKHADLPGSLRVSVLSTLDSDSPPRALFKASAASLDHFAVVNQREEPRPAPNRAGAQVATVWRSGTSATGTLRALNAVGAKGDFYWLFTHEWAPAPDETKIRGLLLELAKAMSVEPAG